MSNRYRTLLVAVLLGTAALLLAQTTNQAPIVTNVVAQQRATERLVDITYDVFDGDGDVLTVAVQASADGGVTYGIIPVSVSGDVGEGITSGTGKHIVWVVGVDLPGVRGSEYRVRVLADDGYVPEPGEMVLISSGTFEMGDHFGEGNSNELPVHTVELDAFSMDAYEVTVGQYRAFVDATGHAAPNWGSVANYAPTDAHPIVYVSWDDAVAYCEWAGKRLPTEAEWEYAARGGLVSKRYVWGDAETPPQGAGNFADETAKKSNPGWTIFEGYDDGYAEASPVGSFSANGYGLYDMAGNVWEWCSDWYGSDYYANSPAKNPTGSSSSSSRVLRGGSWGSTPDGLRVAYRGSSNPSYAFYGYGFRCAQGVSVTP